MGLISGLDTSVVLRLITNDPPDLSVSARQFVTDELSAGRGLVVSDLVVAEAYHALHTQYAVPKLEAAAELYLLLTETGLTASGVAVTALQAIVDSSSKPGLVDRMIHLDYHPVRLVTFEKAASRLEGAVVLK